MNFKKYGRTAQLFDYQTMSEGLVGGILNSDGTITTNAASSSWTITKYIPVAGREFILQRQASGGATSICLYDSNQTYITGLAYNGNGTVTVSANTDVSYIRFTYYRTENTGNIMLNEGSTALPYEPYGNTWVDIPHYIHNTSTGTITTLPAVIYPNDTTATVGLKGNTVQSGTPTPNNPIMPQSCGERTGNLFPLDESKLHVGRIENDGTIDYKVGTLTVGTDSVTYEADTAWRGFYTDFIQVNENENLTFSPNNSSSMAWVCNCYDENGVFLGNTSGQSAGSIKIFTLLAGTKKVRISVTSSKTSYTITKPMLNTGSTALPYEPYGYKIPISSASTTTPVYLGEVESTRLIKKIIFTGSEDENWSGQAAGGGATRFRYTLANSVQADTAHLTSICTHLPLGVEGGTWNTDNIYTISSNYLWVRFDSSFTTTASLKSWLAQQYANGTPVTVWYVLANETTGIVNEPIRKIGDYADTVSGITIPTIAGANSFDVLTTLKPSEVTVNYHGWHTGAVHERDSGQWD